MKTVAFLPAKGSSNRIENKNIKLLDGKPLFLHSLEKLLSCDFIDEVFLDTESESLSSFASHIDFSLLKRDPALASNSTDGHLLFHNEAKHAKADIYIQLLCTSPFISVDTIRRGVDILKKDDQYDSVILVRKDKLYLWGNSKPLYSQEKIPNSIDLPDTVIETMGLYIARSDVALNKRKRYGDRVYLLEATPLEAIDVNYPDDFILANYVAAGMREKERHLFKNLASKITSSMLSDIIDDLGLQTSILGLSLNLKQKKVLGRAKTLKLRALGGGEDYKGIYHALKSYETIVPNDIIVVENQCNELAYFGELNANLAIRSGAIAAIIGGNTRDSSEVASLDFPVFSTGTVCKDVKNRATVDSINKTIEVFGVKVSPNDLIFGDSDGIIVIPKKFETDIINRIKETISKERTILYDILSGKDIHDILSDNGEF